MKEFGKLLLSSLALLCGKFFKAGLTYFFIALISANLFIIKLTHQRLCRLAAVNSTIFKNNFAIKTYLRRFKPLKKFQRNFKNFFNYFVFNLLILYNNYMNKSGVWKRMGKYIVLAGVILLLGFSLFGCNFSVSSTYTPYRDYNYEITTYDVNIVIDKDKTMHITESIQVKILGADTNGIYRYFPISQSLGIPNGEGGRDYKNYENTISNFTVTSGYLLSEYESDGYQFYMIASESTLHKDDTYTFEFSYDFSSGDDRDTTKDFLYYNIIGTGWNTTIDQVNFSITFPKEVDFSDVIFYAGTYGADTTGTEIECSTVINEDGTYTISGSYGPLDYASALTIYLELEQGYFTVSRNYTFDIILLVLFVLFLALTIFMFIKNRRKSPIVDVVEFSAPENLTPTEAGYIYGRSLKGRDISALLVYWADKGYVKIEEKEKNIYVQKLKDLPPNAKEHEKLFFNAVFKTDKPVNCSRMKFDNSFIGEKIQKSLKKDDDKYFHKKSNSYYLLCVLAFVALTILSFVRIDFGSFDVFAFLVKTVAAVIMFLAYLWLMKIVKNNNSSTKKSKWLLLIFPLILIGLAQTLFILYAEAYNDPFFTRYIFPVFALFLFFIYPFLEQYTEYGRKCLGKLNGLRQYILVAEKDRLEALANENPELFYHVLPYAYVLDVSDVYLKKFSEVPLQNPNWMKFSDGMKIFAILMLLDKNLLALTLVLNTTIVRHFISTTARAVGALGIMHIGGGRGGFSGGGSGGGGGGRF